MASKMNNAQKNYDIRRLYSMEIDLSSTIGKLPLLQDWVLGSTSSIKKERKILIKTAASKTCTKSSSALEKKMVVYSALWEDALVIFDLIQDVWNVSVVER